MKPAGWPRAFSERPWAQLQSFLDEVTARHPDFRYLSDVIGTVVRSGADVQLAGSTSMHDLLVIPRPVPDLVYDMIVVRAPGSLRPGPAGQVRIEHLSSTGQDERIDRPVSHAVPLFWRFVAEKYGIHANPLTGRHPSRG